MAEAFPGEAIRHDARPTGRRPIGERAMTGAEPVRLYRARKREALALPAAAESHA